MIEMTVVVAILGLVMTIGIPAIYRLVRREGLSSAVTSVVAVCMEARAQAILKGRMVELHISPHDGHFSVVIPAEPTTRGSLDQFNQFMQSGRFNQGQAAANSGAASPAAANDPRDPSSMIGAHQTGTGGSAQLPTNVLIEMLDVNFVECKDAPSARVRFYANGTSDEFTLVLHGDDGEWRKISLELVTALPEVGLLR